MNRPLGRLISSAHPSSRLNARADGKQGGQALTEFLVLAVSLIPLFLLMPLIAKYQDIAYATQMASRYVAFDAAVRNNAMSSWKPTAQLDAEVSRRFLGAADAPIKTNDTAGNSAADQNAFWVDPQGKSLIADFGKDVVVSYGSGHSQNDDRSGAFSTTQDGTLFTIYPQLSLQAQGIYTANVSVTLANMPAGLKFYQPFDMINLALTRGTSLVFDPWMAQDPTQAEQRFGGNSAVFPAGTLKKYADAADAADAAVKLVDPLVGSGPQLGQLSFWRDVVPQDRLH